MTNQTLTSGPSLAEAQLAVAVAALRRLALPEPMVPQPDEADPRRLLSDELNARLGYAEGTLETIQRLADEAPLEPFGLGDLRQSVVSALDAASGGTCEHCVSSAFTKQADAVSRVVAEFLAGRGISDETEAVAEPEPELPLPDGEFARVEIMGHDSVTGFVTERTRAGVLVMVVSDWDGQVKAEIPGASLYKFVPLPTPLKRPELPQDPQRAIGYGFGEAGGEDNPYPWDENHAADCENADCNGDCIPF